METPLPPSECELGALAARCADALGRSAGALDALRSLRDDFRSFKPGRVDTAEPLARSGFVSFLTTTLDPRRSLNADVAAAAKAVAAVAPYARLPDAERVRLLTEGAQIGPAGLSEPAQDWRLDGLWVFAQDTTGGVTGPSNLVRLAALIAFFEAAVSAVGDVRRRVDRKLHPVQVVDRVTVDLKANRVTVDGRTVEVTENQAILVARLAAANGAGMSGPEIGRSAGISGEFRAGRYRRQIKAIWLKRLLPDPATQSDRKFRLVLPPLPD